jgi:CysZ protein
MLQAFRAFSQGARFHVRGIRFGLNHPSFLFLAVFPFLVTLTLYIIAFYIFVDYSDNLLEMVWNPETGESSWIMGWLHWIYTHIFRWILYLIALVIMFYTFIVISVVLASPVYDYVSRKYERLSYGDALKENTTPSGNGLLTVVKEELKKALVMLVIPIPLIFLPVVGTLLSFLVASVFIAWDFSDFSLSRDCPLLRDRMRAVWRHKWSLLGFGSPILIPFLGLILMPFAILGATTLYFDEMKQASGPKTHPA